MTNGLEEDISSEKVGEIAEADALTRDPRLFGGEAEERGIAERVGHQANHKESGREPKEESRQLGLAP